MRKHPVITTIITERSKNIIKIGPTLDYTFAYPNHPQSARFALSDNHSLGRNDVYRRFYVRFSIKHPPGKGTAFTSRAQITGPEIPHLCVQPSSLPVLFGFLSAFSPFSLSILFWNHLCESLFVGIVLLNSGFRQRNVVICGEQRKYRFCGRTDKIIARTRNSPIDEPHGAQTVCQQAFGTKWNPAHCPTGSEIVIEPDYQIKAHLGWRCGCGQRTDFLCCCVCMLT